MLRYISCQHELDLCVARCEIHCPVHVLFILNINEGHGHENTKFYPDIWWITPHCINHVYLFENTTPNLHCALFIV